MTTVARWELAGKGRRRIGWGAALLVQAVALSVWWLGFGKALPGHRAEDRTLTVRLVTSPPRAARGQHEPLEPPPIARRPERPRLPAPILVAAPEVSITAVVPATGVQTVAAPASGASAPPPGNGRTTLNLALPKMPASSDARLRMADQVRNDPRSHSEKRTLESAMADAAGTLPVETSISTSGSGSKLVRQGSKCLRVYDNRVAALNPTDDRLKDAPMLVSRCFN